MVQGQRLAQKEKCEKKEKKMIFSLSKSLTVSQATL
jgi:hypothetical protein